MAVTTFSNDQRAVWSLVRVVDFATESRGGPCRFAFIDAREEKGFLGRAVAAGLRYRTGPHLDVIVISVSDVRAIAIAVFRSDGPA